MLLAVLAAVAEAKQLLAQGLAVQGVGTSKAVLDDHVEIALILFVDGLEVALFVCDLGVEHLYDRGQPIDLLILGKQSCDVGVLDALDLFEVVLQLGLFFALECLDLQFLLLYLCAELDKYPLMLDPELVVVFLEDLRIRAVFRMVFQGFSVSLLPEA